MRQFLYYFYWFVCCWPLWQIVFEGSSLLCISFLSYVFGVSASNFQLCSHMGNFNTWVALLKKLAHRGWHAGSYASRKIWLKATASSSSSFHFFLFLHPFLLSTLDLMSWSCALSVFICLSLYSLNNERSKRRHLSCCYLRLLQVG